MNGIWRSDNTDNVLLLTSRAHNSACEIPAGSKQSEARGRVARVVLAAAALVPIGQPDLGLVVRAVREVGRVFRRGRAPGCGSSILFF